ncbi:gsiB, partial [Symbiodinium necroappetens]
ALRMRQSLLAALLLSASALVALPAAAADLRIGLQEDPDVLDPDQSRTFVGRIVYASLCDKLVVLTMDLREGVKFHDGTAFDAEAVKANIERSKGLPESRRKSEVKSIESVEVTGPMQVKITLAQPDATLLAQLADRAGMMVSPTAASAAGADFGSNPVCSGPFAFKERVQQDRIVLTRFADYWNADAIHFDS